MISLWIGIAAFILCFLYDINSFTRKNAVVHCFFTVGAVLLAVSSALDLWQAMRAGAFTGALDVVLLLLAVICFAALIYSLFFALPFEETYVKSEEGNKAYDQGVYALCRHPGVLFYFLMQLFFGLAALPERALINGMILSAINVLYAWFQDRITFEKIFSNYSEYRKNVPFLVPTAHSAAEARKFFGRTNKGEGEQ